MRSYGESLGTPLAWPEPTPVAPANEDTFRRTYFAPHGVPQHRLPDDLTLGVPYHLAEYFAVGIPIGIAIDVAHDGDQRPDGNMFQPPLSQQWGAGRLGIGMCSTRVRGVPVCLVLAWNV